MQPSSKLHRKPKKIHPSRLNLHLLLITLTLLVTPSFITPLNYGFPTVGILTTHDKRFHEKERFFELTAFSFVAKSYTQWVEQTGAMPVLIPFDSEL